MTAADFDWDDRDAEPDEPYVWYDDEPDEPYVWYDDESECRPAKEEPDCFSCNDNGCPSCQPTRMQWWWFCTKWAVLNRLRRFRVSQVKGWRDSYFEKVKERDAALADVARWSQAAQAAGDLCREVEQERDRLRGALTDRLRPRLNGIFGALLGQGSTLAGEMRKALDVLDGLAAPVSSVEPEPRCGEGDPVCDESVPDGHCSGHGQVGPCPMTEHDATCCDHWRRHDEHRAPVDGCPWCPDPEPAEVVASIRETHGLLGAVLATQALEAEQPAVPEQAQPRVWKRGDPEPNANRVRANNGIVFSSCGLGDKPWFATYESGGDGRWYSWGDLVNPNTGPTPLVEVVEAPAGQDAE